MRALLFSPHFAEYSCRLAIELSKFCETMLVLDSGNTAAECSRELIGETGKRVAIRRLSKGSRLAQIYHSPRVLRWYEAFQPDVVHFQEVPCFVGDILRRRVGRKTRVVLTVHDPSPHSGADSRMSARQQRFVNRLRRRADAVLVHGEYCRSLLVALQPELESKIRVTRHGGLALPPQEPTVAQGSRTVLFLGRLEAYKGLDVLAQAAKQVEAQAPDIQFRVVGRGSELGRFLELTSSLNNTHVIGRYFSPEEAVRELQGAAVVVAPYRDATQSGVLAAAFANGRPVIASDVGGLSELVTDGVNGRLVPPGDSRALAAAILEIMSNSTVLHAMSIEALHTASSALGWESIAAETYDEYRALL